MPLAIPKTTALATIFEEESFYGVVTKKKFKTSRYFAQHCICRGLCDFELINISRYVSTKIYHSPTLEKFSLYNLHTVSMTAQDTLSFRIIYIELTYDT